MDLHWRPVGPLPASVYWRRRGVVLAVLLLLLLGLSRCAADPAPQELAQQSVPPPAAETAPSPGAPTTSGSPGASATPGGRASAGSGSAASAVPSVDPAAAGGAPACPDALLTLDADAAPPRLASGSSTSLRLAVTNTGSTPCSRPLGQGAVELSVFSGADRVWSSDDCAPGGPEEPVVLQPGERRLLAVRWSGSRSRPGCTGPTAPAGAGTYRVVARVGSLAREGRTFTIQ